ncbi:MAG: UDP-N-acetylglucosamine 2-epimerase (non-hydrolyzing) [Candidatus Pacebacteria bacterium]|nr:UDP-N-acetylglucosamine 2-epimerase (non-hydrolyzing) [Candidatus Paceibacterota bacterium]
MIALLVGTRPELIKIAPVLRELKLKKVPHVLIHSNQHYSEELDAQIIRDLGIIKPDINLHVGSGSHAVQTGRILEGVESTCIRINPQFLIVHGDTNTTLAGALAAKKLHFPVGHIEAGLRSFDYSMPEEINRILTDRISDVLFAPTEGAKKNLAKEGIRKNVFVVGNTVVDALNQHMPLAKKTSILSRLHLNKDTYILVTAHRAENVDDKERLKLLLNLLEHASRVLKMPIVWPMHPRTSNSIQLNNLSLPREIMKLPPVGYLEMLALMNAAKLILTDSGGIQEEAYILKKPLITLRSSTERPETLTANSIVDLDQSKFDTAVKLYKEGKMLWTNAFGNGDSAKKIVVIMDKLLSRTK